MALLPKPPARRPARSSDAGGGLARRQRDPDGEGCLTSVAQHRRQGHVDALVWGYVDRHWRGLLACCALLALIGAMAAGYIATLRTVWVQIDGRALVLRSHLATVGDALHEARIFLQPEDRVEPALDSPLQNGLRVQIARARTVRIVVDGELRTHRTLATRVGEILTEAGVRWIPEDRLTLGGQVVAGEQPLYAELASLRTVSSRGDERNSPFAAPPAPVEITVQRAVPISVQDGQTPFTFLTTARTLGEALLDKSITIYAADKVQPALDTPIRSGLKAYIERSRPVTLLADGQVRETRTRAATVGDLLQEEEVQLGAMDYVRPAADAALTNGLRVTVMRVRESEVVEEEPIPFAEEMRGSADLELDLQRIDNYGSPGVYKRSLKVRYENDVEVSRTLDREWVDKPPQNRITSYGMKIVERTITTSEGTFTYWRKIRSYVTSYSPSESGTSRDAPWFGRTRLGWTATKGVIAIDPTVIPFLTRIYVPGYGVGTAADTGGGIKGKHIDLCYDDGNLVTWWGWKDIYLLSPAPPADQILWILPNYPGY
jgi:resuscitation-promoting factor RpfB